MKTKQNSFLIVLVIYNQFLEDSVTFKSLLRAVKKTLNFKVKIVVYDNSLVVREDLSFLKQYRTFFEVDYVSNCNNPGISKAYNYAYKTARKTQLSWLLLLDHDTKLPLNYLETFIYSCDNLNPSIVACVPRIYGEFSKKLISPLRLNSYGLLRRIQKEIVGDLEFRVMAINSGAFLNVNFLSEIGGFSKKYPLDMLDFWLFSVIFGRKKKVYLFDICLEHNLSVSDFENNVSLLRYESIISAEKKFFYQNNIWKVMHRVRLIKRLLVQIRFKDKSFFMKTLKSIFQ